VYGNNDEIRNANSTSAAAAAAGMQPGNEREAENDLFPEPAAVVKIPRITRYNYER